MMYQKSLIYLERAQQEVPLFRVLVEKLTKNFSIQGKSSNTLHNYTRCQSHLALYYKQCPTLLTLEQVQEYLYHCQQLHKTPSESFSSTLFITRIGFYRKKDLEC